MQCCSGQHWGKGTAGPAFPPCHPSKHTGNCREVRRGFSLAAPGLLLWQTGIDGCPDRELMIEVFSQPWPGNPGLRQGDCGAALEVQALLLLPWSWEILTAVQKVFCDTKQRKAEVCYEFLHYQISIKQCCKLRK